jgi:acetyl esterase
VDHRGGAAVAAGAGSVAIAGDSSGGTLAAVATRELSRQGARVTAQVLVYPMLDATACSKSYRQFAIGYRFTRKKSLWYFDQYLPAHAERANPRISPLFEQDLTDLPPTFVLTAECDPLRDEGEEFVRRITAAGGEAALRRYEGMIHGFFQMTALTPAARQAQVDISNWLHTIAARTTPTPLGVRGIPRRSDGR